MNEEPKSGKITFGYWLVAFVDLLGQKEAFMRADFIPDGPAKAAAFEREVMASLGVIYRMRSLLSQFQEAVFATAGRIDEESPLYGFPDEAIARYQKMQVRRVHEHRLSDGIILACPMKRGEGHATPVVAAQQIIFTCCALMLFQLAQGRPIRGGLDVGMGTEHDGEMFGASLVKAYTLESQVAQHPRLVVGKTLVDYLKATSLTAGTELEQRFERAMGASCLKMIGADEDGQLILDYAGPTIREALIGSNEGPLKLMPAARHFSHTSREGFRENGNEKLFGRYSKVVRYLDERARFWGDASEKGYSVENVT